MKFDLIFLIPVMLFLMIISSACEPSSDPDSSALMTLPQEFLYKVNHRLVRHEDNPFELVQDNCGSPSAASATLTHNRMFTRTLVIELTESIINEVGNGKLQVAKAILSEELGREIGVVPDSIETVCVSRPITVPANTEIVVNFQWLEDWSIGRVKIQYLDGEFLASTPFRILNTPTLTQLGIDYRNCVVVIPVPDRDVEISMDAAMSAQEKAMTGLMTGSIEFTEDEFSSLVNGVISQNAQIASVIDNMTFWFTPEAIYTRVALQNGLEYELVGNALIQDDRLFVDLIGANSGDMVALGSTLDVIEGAINRALSDPSLGIAVDVELMDGGLSVGFGE